MVSLSNCSTVVAISSFELVFFLVLDVPIGSPYQVAWGTLNVIDSASSEFAFNAFVKFLESGIRNHGVVTRLCKALNPFQVIISSNWHLIFSVDLSLVLHLMNIPSDILKTTSAFSLYWVLNNFSWNCLVNATLGCMRCWLLWESSSCYWSWFLHCSIAVWIKCSLWGCYLTVSAFISSIAWSHIMTTVLNVLWCHTIYWPLVIYQWSLAFTSRLLLIN